MSNGERYHRDSMTCAHLKLPFGTMLKVRNLRNDKEVIVEVTDRGPFAKKYILDLSRAAARELGIIGRGFAPVEISIYTPAKGPFRLKDEEAEIPELDLQHRIMAIYPEPLWQQADSTDTE
jgi:rare lipoprotein A